MENTNPGAPASGEAINAAQQPTAPSAPEASAQDGNMDYEAELDRILNGGSEIPVEDGDVITLSDGTQMTLQEIQELRAQKGQGGPKFTAPKGPEDEGIDPVQVEITGMLFEQQVNKLQEKYPFADYEDVRMALRQTDNPSFKMIEPVMAAINKRESAKMERYNKNIAIRGANNNARIPDNYQGGTPPPTVPIEKSFDIKDTAAIEKLFRRVLGR